MHLFQLSYSPLQDSAKRNIHCKPIGLPTQCSIELLVSKQFVTNLAKCLINTSIVFDISSDIKVDFFITTSNVAIIEEFVSGCPIKLAFYSKMNLHLLFHHKVYIYGQIHLYCCVCQFQLIGNDYHILLQLTFSFHICYL